jgi:ATP synthase protein I
MIDMFMGCVKPSFRIVMPACLLQHHSGGAASIDFAAVNPYHPHVFRTADGATPDVPRREPMLKAVYLQIGATILASLIAGLVMGLPGALSAALGGAACVLPNFLFALRLSAVAKRPDASYPLEFFVGEFVKIASTVGLLATVQLVYADVHWLTLFIGFVVALKANLFAFLVKN